MILILVDWCKPLLFCSHREGAFKCLIFEFYIITYLPANRLLNHLIFVLIKEPSHEVSTWISAPIKNILKIENYIYFTYISIGTNKLKGLTISLDKRIVGPI
jgi:hypothetical protein